MKLKFLEDTFYRGELIFEKDKVYEVSEELGWAGRWLKRGAVEVVESKIKAPKVSMPAPPPQPENKLATEKPVDEVTKPVVTSDVKPVTVDKKDEKADTKSESNKKPTESAKTKSVGLKDASKEL